MLGRFEAGLSERGSMPAVRSDRGPAGGLAVRTSSVEDIIAHDVFEHLPSKIFTLNEAHRVLQANGTLDLWVPCVYLSDGRVNPGAFADPTHTTFWTMDDRYYFCEEGNHPRGERGRLGPAYGITALFRPLHWELYEYGEGAERRSKVRALLQAVKN